MKLKVRNARLWE